ncbi:MAG TPA: discoidin domain-containing protein [Actinocrinis sp.]|nr:discoidin domain-containing protein [Actinocrinis sp.]
MSATNAATTLALGSSHGSSPGAQSANAYRTTDPGASTAATGPTGAGSSGTSAGSGRAGTDARSPGTSADQTRSASPDVSGQAATGQSAEPPTPRSNPLPPTAGTSAVPVAPPNQDLALGRPATASSFTQNYVAQNAVDGNTGTYWESQNGSTVFPQSLTVNLGSVTTVGRLVLNLPPVAAWNSRTETLSVLGAGASGGFSTIAGSASYGFNAGSGGNDDTVTVAFGAVHVQYVELVFTANTGWPAAQLSELGVYS